MEDPAKVFFDSLSDDNKSLLEEMKRDTEAGMQKKTECIAAWAVSSPFYSSDLMVLMDGLHVRTFGGQQSGGYQKAILCCELGDKIESEGMIHHPLVYLASSSDVAFALGLRFRKIYLVDPELSNESTLDNVRKILSLFDLTEEMRPDGGSTLCCKVNFGHGKEAVTIHCVPIKAEQFSLPNETELGGVISFQNGGSAHPMLFPDLCMKLVEGGILYDNSQSFIEEEIYLATQEREGLFEAPSGQRLDDMRQAVQTVAGAFGLEAKYPFSGFSSPYFRRQGVISHDFARKMVQVTKEKNERNRSFAESIGALRRIQPANGLETP